jgi:serine protease Do
MLVRTARQTALIAAALAMLAAAPLPLRAADNANPPTATEAFYDRVTPSLVAVQFTYVGETLQKDFIVPGIVVDDQGLIMIPLSAVNDQIPDEQLQKFKIIIPRQDADNEEIDAEFQGRDERCDMAFVKPKASTSTTAATKRSWTPIHFESVPSAVGDAVSSVGLLPKSAGYHTIYCPAVVSANLRGPVKQVRVAGGGLAAPQAPVFNADGKAIGIVLYQPPAELDLDDDVKNQQQAISRLLASSASNRYFMPTSEFAIGLQSPPTPGHPIPLAWTGLPEQLLSGLRKNDAALFNLANQPAIQINDILPGSPAEKAGLQKKDIIIKYEGEALERGDQPEELPMILRHKLIQRKPGEVVTFTVISGKDQPPHDVKVTLEPQPKRENLAQRYWSDDIGFGVREMVLLDRYGLKLKKGDADGVLVTVLKEGSSAASAGLHPYDMITQVNGQPVTDLSTFKSAYEDLRRDHEHEAIVLVVHRGGGDETIRIEPPQ